MKNSKTKKILSILLAVMMVVGMIPATVIPVSAALVGSGTESDPYVVGTQNAIEEAIAKADGEKVFLKLEPTYDNTIHWTDTTIKFESDVTIDMNGATIELNYERASSAGFDYGIEVLDGATVTLCGKGEVICGRSFIEGTLVIKDEVTISTLNVDGTPYYISPEGRGKVIMYGGSINCLYILPGNEAGMFHMYDGTITRAVKGAYYESPGGKFNLSGGTITGSNGYGFTYRMADDDVAPKSKINGFLAYDSEGVISKIKNMGSFESYGKDRLYAEFAGPGIISESPAIYETGALFDLGKIVAGSYPIEFKSPKLTVGFVHAGYYYEEQLAVYDSEGTLVETVSNTNRSTTASSGISYDLNQLSTGYYKLVETVTMKDKDGKNVFDPVSNTIYVDWVQSLSLNCNISGVQDDTVTTVTICKYGTTTPLQTAEVIGNGSYTFTDLSWGNYTITLTAPGYNDTGISRLVNGNCTSNFTMTVKEIDAVSVGAVFSGTPTDATTSTINAEVTSTKWYKKNGTDWSTLSSTDTITEGNTYRCQITLGTTNDAVFADGYTVTIGGYTATKGSTANTWYLDRSITGYTDYIDVIEIMEPVVGYNPSFGSYDIQSAYTEFYMIEWYKCDANGVKIGNALTKNDVFEADSYYRAEVTVTPSENWAFDTENLNFWINDETVQYFDSNGGVTGWKLFEVKYPINVKSSDSTKGGAYGGGPYHKGETVTLMARPKSGYKFVKWLRDGEKVSTNATYSFTVNGSTNYVAVFASSTPDVWVGGVGMTYGDYLAVGATTVSANSPINGCYAFYDDGVLSLRNYSYNGKGYEYSDDLYAVIYAPKEIDILLSSVSTLTQTDSTYGTVIYLAEGGTIRGSNVSGGSAGELIASGGQMGIYAASGDIIVNGGTLNVSNCTYGLDSETYYQGSVVINDGTLNISASDFAIKAYDVTVNYGNVTARCTNTVSQYDANYYAICAEGTFTFDDCIPKASVNSTGNPLTSFLFTDVATYDYIALEPLHTVTFIIDGAVHATEYTETGGTVTTPVDPDVSGRRFLGWYTQTGDPFDFDTPITQNVSLYAEFGEPYKITDVTLSVTSPVSGEHPSFTVTLPDGANYTHFIKEGFYKEEFWWDSTAGKGLAETDTFISGHRYIVSVYLKAAKNYTFPADVSQITATIESDGTVILDTVGDYNRYLKVTFVLNAPLASVSGMLYDMEEGVDAWVYLYEEDFTEPSYEVKANSDGSYLITDVIPGNYTVKVIAEGYDEKSVGPVEVDGTATYSFYMTKKATDLRGDVNLDGVIDVNDYQLVVNEALSDGNEQIGTAEYDEIIKYDLDGDGYLDAIDCAIMALIVNGHREVHYTKKGDYDLDGEAYTESDLIAMNHVLSDIEGSAPTLSTLQKYASDLNCNGKVDEDDLTILVETYGTIEETTCEENIKVYYRWGNSYTTCTATAMCTLCNKKVAVETVDSVLNADGSYTATFTNSLLGTKTYKKQ